MRKICQQWKSKIEEDYNPFSDISFSKVDFRKRKKAWKSKEKKERDTKDKQIIL